MTEARLFTKGQRLAAVRIGLEKRRRRLERSMAHCRDAGRAPRASDLERWERMRSEIAEFESALARLEAGKAAPPSEKTGRLAALLPDTLDEER